MKKKTALLSAAALIVGVITLSPKIALAYQGDPNVQGPNYTAERHDIMTQAFDSGNYNTWKEQMAGRGVANRITEANFSQFAEAHRLASEGDLEGAAKIREELGLGLKNGSGQANGTGQNRGMGQHQESGVEQANGMGQRNK